MEVLQNPPRRNWLLLFRNKEQDLATTQSFLETFCSLCYTIFCSFVTQTFCSLCYTKFCERSDLTDVGLPENACNVALVDIQGRERIQHTYKRSFALLSGTHLTFQVKGTIFHIIWLYISYWEFPVATPCKWGKFCKSRSMKAKRVSLCTKPDIPRRQEKQLGEASSTSCSRYITTWKCKRKSAMFINSYINKNDWLHRSLKAVVFKLWYAYH